MAAQTIVVWQQSRIPLFCVKERHIERLRRELPAARILWCRDQESFVAALPGADTVLCWRFRQEWFDLAPRLRRIATPAAGRDFFRVTEVPERVTIRNGTFHAPIMAETALGMILAVNRGILSALRHQLQGELWPDRALFDSRLIAGTHAVIIGFGRIGGHIGRMLKLFGVRITGIRRHPEPTPPEWFDGNDAVRPTDQLHEALSGADHVILVLPADTGTDLIMGAAEFAALPGHAVLYNLGRGNCIDEAALAEALRNGVIAGACLDVFRDEPLSAASPLAAADIPGLLRMPHASAYCECYIDRFLDECIGWLTP